MKFIPKLIIQAVYKSQSGAWRGFCAPYDVTCEARTKNAAVKKLERLVKLYEEGLVKYSFPQHLSLKPLTDDEDKDMFEKVLSQVSGRIEKQIREDYLLFQEEKVETFRTHNPQSEVYYSYPCI
jgi:hypothetical protein